MGCCSARGCFATDKVCSISLPETESEDMRDRFVGLATGDDIELSSSSQLTLGDVVNK
jgi:hypothetical protein